MNLYRISQDKHNDYDTYDSAVVAADDEAEARMTHPSGNGWDGVERGYGTWANAEFVKVNLIGVAAEGIERGQDVRLRPQYLHH